MKPASPIILVLMLCAFRAWPQAEQQGRVTGTVIDKDSRQPLAAASVALVREGDSVRVAFAYTSKAGDFSLHGPEGHYRLSVTYLGYQPVFLEVAITSGRLMDLGAITLQKAGLTLATVEIVQQKPLVWKKDTLEFNAAYFKTRENALMEELLKKLPGIQVARDGTITVNGAKVEKLLINGRPFFGDDPTMATRNLAAAIIDKIQLIDQPAENAPFPGINDGKKGKVINLTIREDKRDRFLGQATVGYGTGSRFAVKGNLHRFTDVQQLSFLGNGNSINGYHEGGGPGLGAGGDGITRSWNGGVNYSRFPGKRLELNSSYYVRNSYTETQRSSARQNLLPGATYYYYQDALAALNNTQQDLHLRMAYKADSTQELVVMSRLSYATGSTRQENTYSTQGDQQQLVNSGGLRNTTTNRSPGFSTSVFYEKRFRKPGHNLRTDLTFEYNSNQQEGFNHSDNLFAQPGGGMIADTINQRTAISGRNRRVHYRLMYAVPAFKESSLQLAYIFTHQYTASGKFTYDYNTVKNAYDRLNDSLSNAFESRSNYHLIIASLRATKHKFDYDIGMNLLFTNMDNRNITAQNTLLRHWINILPRISLGYAFTEQKRLGISYSGQTTPPDVAQLWPVPDNSNPLYIRQGNPELQPAFIHNLHMGYHALNPATMRSLSARLSAAFINNKVVNANWFDTLGRQLSQPVNINGAYRLQAAVVNTFPLKKWQTFLDANTSLVLDRDISYMNGVKRPVRTWQASQELRLGYAHKDLFDCAVAANVQYNGVQYAMQGDNNMHYLNYIFSFNGSINLPGGLSIGGNLDYMRNTGRAAGYNQDAAMLNAFISKSLFRRKQGLVKLQAFDLLNQNVSISRQVGESYIEDVQAQVLQRFFLLSLSYFLK